MNLYKKGCPVFTLSDDPRWDNERLRDLEEWCIEQIKLVKKLKKKIKKLEQKEVILRQEHKTFDLIKG